VRIAVFALLILLAGLTIASMAMRIWQLL